MKLITPVVVVLWILSRVLRRSQGLAITVDEVECVYEEIGFGGDTISGNFISKWSNRGVDFTVSDPGGIVVMSIDRSSGDKFEIMAQRHGLYKFCFYNHNSGSEVVVFYVHIGHVPKEEDLAKDDHLGQLSLRIYKLKEAMESTVTEQRYMRARDARHRRTNENTKRRVMAYTLAEYAVLVMTSIAQTYYVRRLFRHSYGYNRVSL